ncbi:P-loop NTPase family protein [Chitinophaga rhizophila]|uniref:Hpr(Ser) kinase/phosphatase n=1 Tax=Chitinophaga rhizophila TaxID=2866212 RepID=A0ABS7GJQ5_9BACT|nr:hypothetical protein [Chitinophaga rhizophila]MBW8687420.1 hypothetical protein [Chitinophaga rhizophila]
MYKYWGFGLLITSSIKFPELMPATSSHTDVTITIGSIPLIHASASFSTGHITYTLNDYELLFTVPGIASYYIAHGKQIIIAPVTAKIEERILRMFVLAGAMAGVLQQRKQVPLHAAGIVEAGALTLICGRSGAGKSTTLAGLQDKHYRIFTDDVTVLRQLPGDEQVSGIAAYPMLKLWEQSLQTLQLEDRSFPVMPGIEKYGIFFHQDFDTEPYPVNRIILLATGDVTAIDHQRLIGSNAFTQVVQHIYKPALFRQPFIRGVCFNTISALTRQADTHLITRPLHCEPEELLATVTSIF